jgi:hypothetical protein
MPNPTRIKNIWEAMDEALDIDAAKEAVLRLGLKADNTAADRATALGFGDKTYYHGTNADIKKFKIEPDVDDYRHTEYDLFHEATQHGTQSRPFISTTPKPKMADYFSKFVKEEGANILPLRLRGKNFNIKDKKAVKEVVDMIENNIGSQYPPTVVDSVVSQLKKGNPYWKVTENPMVTEALQDLGYDSFNAYERGKNYFKILNKNTFDPANIRSKFAKFNPKKAGIGAGSIMSADLLAAPKKPDQDLSRFAPKPQHEFRQAPKGFLDKAFGVAADTYQYGKDEGGWLGEFLYSPGARALRHLERGTTPMVKTGRLKVPTGDALLDLMGIFML